MPPSARNFKKWLQRQCRKKQTSCVSFQLFSVRVALFFALRFFFCLCLFGAFTLTFGFLFGFLFGLFFRLFFDFFFFKFLFFLFLGFFFFGLFLRFFLLFSFGLLRLSRLYLLFFLFFGHGRLLSGSTLFGNGLPRHFR